MDNSTAQFHKIIFKLTHDADGYPPVEYESLWGIQRGAGVYELDNTPYYLYGVSKGDWVLTRAEAQELIEAGSFDEALTACWKDMLLAEVTDATGINPFINEINYGLSHASAARDCADAVILLVAHLSVQQRRMSHIVVRVSAPCEGEEEEDRGGAGAAGHDRLLSVSGF